MADYIMTIDSDDEGPALRTQKQVVENDEIPLNPDFAFDLSNDLYRETFEEVDAKLGDQLDANSKPAPFSVEDIIARHRKPLKRKRDTKEEPSESRENSSSESGDDEDLDESEDDPLETSDEEDVDLSQHEEADDSGSSSDESEDESPEQKARKAAFFDDQEISSDVHSSFLTMNLSRPLLKALTNMGFQKPTPIQAATIPMALLGKDIVGGAVTGSGKTAAFIIPMLERLLFREKGTKAAATRCLVLVPTRELAVQCFEVGTKLAAHTDIRFCLVVGGLSLKSQEVALRSRPDVVIATPGRLIDHLRNSPSFALDTLDILVLDEADRMLSEGFSDELTEIIKSCPVSRQTMLFSATMTDSVDELVKMSLNKPVRLFVDPKRSTAHGLVQEFVRVRAGKEDERPALLVALCKRTFKSGVIIFLRSKKLAHQMRIVFGLLGLKADELHGDLTQEQRLKALDLFRNHSVDFLMATDLASRGLDIKGVETVINYDMPGQLAQYLHRVGRTARAGKQGRSVTLVGESDRKLLKAAIKHSVGNDSIRHRIIPAEIAAGWAAKLEDMKGQISAIMKEEKEEKQFRRAEMELKKGQNMIEHRDEIYSRPARTWFQTKGEKQNAEETSKRQYEAESQSANKRPTTVDLPTTKPKREKFSGLSRRVKRRKLALEEDVEVGGRKEMNAAIRSAKKAARPAKIGVETSQTVKTTRRKSKKARPKSGSTFEKELGTKGGVNEGVRANKRDAIPGKKKISRKR